MFSRYLKHKKNQTELEACTKSLKMVHLENHLSQYSSTFSSIFFPENLCISRFMDRNFHHTFLWPRRKHFLLHGTLFAYMHFSISWLHQILIRFSMFQNLANFQEALRANPRKTFRILKLDDFPHLGLGTYICDISVSRVNSVEVFET